MTGRDRVKASLTFKKPDRVPRDLWASRYIKLFNKKDLEKVLSKFPIDIRALKNDKEIEQTAKKGSYIDDWGSLWQTGEPGVIGEVKKPALEEWSNLRKFKPPYHLIRDRNIAYINKSCEETDNFVLSEVAARPFERLQFLRGTENLLLDIGYGSTEFKNLLNIVHDYYLADIESWCKTNVDGIYFMDDWGTNLGLLINPKFWMAIFKPLYKEYCEMIHKAGKYAFFHTDGNTETIFGDFIEVGIDAINSQLFTMNIENIGKKYKGKITFWGEIDRQSVLPFGKHNDVRKSVLRVRKALEDNNGGIIAQCEFGKGNPVENIESVFQTWEEMV